MARENAGRHYRGQRGSARMAHKVREHGAHYGGEYKTPVGFLLSMTKDELVEDGSPASVAELRRRGRDAEGMKLAWAKSNGGRRKRADHAGSLPKPPSPMSRAAELRAQGMSKSAALKQAWMEYHGAGR